MTNKVLSSISHIEELPVLDFLYFITHIDEFTATEKVDGSQLLFGIDEKGFYTSRESKGGKRVYDDSDYGLSFSSTYKRAAHKLLKQALPILQGAGLKSGDQIEAEILYGKLPNVVPYSDDRNYLIFLRTTDGDANIDLLQEALCDQSFSVSVVTPYTTDGKTVNFKDATSTWEFSVTPYIDINYRQVTEQVSGLYSGLKSYLTRCSGVDNLKNVDITRTALNKTPAWCNQIDWKFYKQEIKEKRTNIHNTILSEYVLPIKEILLDLIVRKQKSKYGPDILAGGWIEGVVFKHKFTGMTVKLVDKNKFGVIRELAWGTRNALTDSVKGIDMPSSFLGNTYLTMATSIGHPYLGTLHKKRYIKKFGNTFQECIGNLSANVDVDVIKGIWISLVDQKILQLSTELNRYQNDFCELEKHLGHQLSQCVNERTLSTFAETFWLLNGIKEKAFKAIMPADLIEILITG